MNQSLGNEGNNVFVNNIIVNPNTSYVGCYQDNTSSPLMTFIGGTPPPPSVPNGSFNEPQLQAGQSLQTPSIVGWYADGGYVIILNNNNVFGIATPYPYGIQCLVVCNTVQIGSTSLVFSTGIAYTISVSACGSYMNNTSYANTINVIINGETVLAISPTGNAWTMYSATFNVQTSGEYPILFTGTTASSGGFTYSTAIQNVQVGVGTTSNSVGTYSYDDCQQAAIDGGYQYFALQNVNPVTAQGYCAVSTNQVTPTSLGTGTVASGEVALWASGTQGQPGNTAILGITGSLSVINSGGQSVFSTNNSTAQPGNYFGCYGDSPTRAMPLYNGGSQSYDLQQCQQIAQDNDYAYYALQNSTSGTNAQCALSNDFSQSIEYGPAQNCTLLSDGTYSGGAYSNAIYNNASPSSNYYLILEDDGFFGIFRGNSPSDNQGLIWSAKTGGKQQGSNSTYAAANGVYGQNWILSSSTMAAGDFIGSPNGYLVLIMQTDGNLVLYTFQDVVNCQRMSDNNMGGGVGANALYNINEVGIPSNMGQLAFIDQNSELHQYPSTIMQYSNSFKKSEFMDSPGNDIDGAAYSNATVKSCNTTCIENSECGGFVFDTESNVCYPKNTNTYPYAPRQINNTTNLYMRNQMPMDPPEGATDTTANIDTISYQNYVNGGSLGSQYGLSQATKKDVEQVSYYQNIMDTLSQQIAVLTNQFSEQTKKSDVQADTNYTGIKQNIKEIKNINYKISQFDTTIDDIVNNSKVVVTQKNYNYIFWAILAVIIVIITIVIFMM
jgi:hypothetical protein